MTWQTILIVTAWVFAVIAISVAFGARKQAGETESLAWRLNKEDHESRMREIGNYEQLSHRVYVLEKKVGDLKEKIDSITEEEDCEPCRPRSFVGVVGDKVCVCRRKEETEELKRKIKGYYSLLGKWQAHADSLLVELKSRIEKGE